MRTLVRQCTGHMLSISCTETFTNKRVQKNKHNIALAYCAGLLSIIKILKRIGEWFRLSVNIVTWMFWLEFAESQGHNQSVQTSCLFVCFSFSDEVRQ